MGMSSGMADLPTPGDASRSRANCLDPDPQAAAIGTMDADSLANAAAEHGLGQWGALGDPALAEIALAIVDNLPRLHVAFIVSDRHRGAESHRDAFDQGPHVPPCCVAHSILCTKQVPSAIVRF
jgi:hypothetical protein